MASRRTSLSDYADSAIAREIDSKYDDVRTVSKNIEFVTSVAEALGNVELLEKMDAVLEEPFKSYLISLGMIESDISLVASLETQINSVVDNEEAILAMYQAIPNINEVLASIQQIRDLAEELSSVRQISAIVDEVVTVAGVADEVAIVGNNIQAVLDVPALALQTSVDAGNAAQSALDAAQSATDANNTLGIVEIRATDALNSANSASSSASTAISMANEASISSVNALNSATSASASAASAAASLVGVQSVFDSFDDRYLGSKTSDPIVDNDGDVLTAGVVYWNSVAEELRFYNGATWETPTAQAATSAAAALASENAAMLSSSAASTSAAEALSSKMSAEASAASASNSMVNASNSATASSNSAVEAEAAKVATESMLDIFQDMYLGPKLSDPTVDNDGETLHQGAMYYNVGSIPYQLKIWTGTEWDLAAFNVSDAVASFNGRNGVVVLTKNDVVSVLGFDPENIDQTVSTDSNVEFASVQLGGASVGEGLLSWNSVSKSAEITMGNGVTLGVGEEIYYPKMTMNGTSNTIEEGTPVMLSGSVGGVSYITPAIANGTIPAEYYIGIATEDILPLSSGRIVYFGSIHDLDTSIWPAGTVLYVSETVAGGFTNVKPNSPNLAITAAIVTYSDASEGRIFVRYGINPIAENVNYDNDNSGLLASNVQSAIDELQLTKADLSTLSSNITMYPTTSSSDVVGYSRMVTSITDVGYDDVAVDVPTGAIVASGQMVGQLISDPGVIVGNPGVLNITTIGNIAKTAGNSSSYAQFYFRLYHRDAAGVETMISESSHTPPVNPAQLNEYQEFSATAILNNGVWLATDRIVVKYYADLDNGSNPEYKFQFGGSNPVRTMLPVPITVIPSDMASDILVDTAEFVGVLDGADSTVQAALETLDVHLHTGVYEPLILRNTAFNKNFGSSAGTVTQGNDTRVVNGQTAYSWGDHSTVGYITDVSGQNLALADNSQSGFVTATSNSTFTNKSGLISQWTNNVGYVTNETDPVYTASSWYSTVNNSSSWDEAYDYSLIGHVPLSGGTMTGALNGTNVVLSGYLRGPSVFVIDPAAFGNVTGKVVIAGDLQVDGMTTTINSTVVDIVDKNITVAKGSSNKSAANGAGVSIDCGVDGYVSMSYNASMDQIEFNRTIVAGSFIGNASTASEADTLDGHHGSYYLDYGNLTNVPSINNGVLSISSSGVISGSGVFTANNLTNVNIDIEHNISGVAAGDYGSIGKIPMLSVDATGHITSASEFEMGTYAEFLSAFNIAEGD